MHTLRALMISGYPFAWIISRLVALGDGTGNETSTIAFLLWSAFFGIVVWLAAIMGCVWAWNHLAVTIH
jgi:hypothetical protein